MQRRQALNTATGAAVALGSLGLVSYASAGENVSLRGPIMDGDPFNAARGKIRVAFAIAPCATVIDFAGPVGGFPGCACPRSRLNDERDDAVLALYSCRNVGTDPCNQWTAYHSRLHRRQRK